MFFGMVESFSNLRTRWGPTAILKSTPCIPMAVAWSLIAATMAPRVTPQGSKYLETRYSRPHMDWQDLLRPERSKSAFPRPQESMPETFPKRQAANGFCRGDWTGSRATG